MASDLQELKEELAPTPPSVNNRNPGNGAVGVLLNANLSFDLHRGSSPLHDATILIQLNGVNVWLSGSQQPGFVVIRSVIGDGYSFSINPNVDLSPLTVYTLRVWAENDTNNVDTSWSFTTCGPSVSPIKIQEIFVVAKDAIKIIFTANIVTHGGYGLPVGYNIIGLGGAEDPIVKSVYPIISRVSSFVIIEVQGLRETGNYQLTVDNNKLYDTYGSPVNSNIIARWHMRRTKVDSALLGATNRLNKKIGSNIRGIIEAIMISDETIGGSY